MTIHLQPLPLPEVQAKQVRDWLAQPAFGIFVEWLSIQAAKHTAEAGNLIVQGGDPELIEAQKSAAEARRFQAAWEIMLQFMDRNFIPDHVKLVHQPINVKA